MTTFFPKSILFALLAVLCVTGKVFAQEVDETTGISAKKMHFFDDLHGELGINTVSLFRAISNKGQDSSQLSPYLINGRISWRGFGIRGGVGGRHNKSFTFVSGFKDSEKRTNTLINYRVGVDYRLQWRNKANLSIGADWVTRSMENTRRLDSGFDIIEFNDIAFLTGGGVSFNGNYWLTKRLGLGLEASAYYLTGELEQGRKFVNFPELNDGLTTSEIEEASFPIALFAIWRF